MKIKKSVLTLVLALAVTCGVVIGAGASSTLQEIKAYLNSGITVKYNNAVQTMTDTNGKTVYPITYEGTTYLPVRAVSKMLGIGVEWDQATQSVLLTDGAGGGTDLIETFEPYSFTDENRQSWNKDITRYYAQVRTSEGKSQSIGGVNTDHWALMYTAMYCENPTVSGYYNIGGTYHTLTFQAYSSHDVTLSVYGDNDTLLGEFPLKGSQVPQTFTVSVEGTKELHFQTVKTIENKVAVSTYLFDANLT